MRFAIAIGVLVLSGVSLLLGIGQRTFLAPASEISVSVSEPVVEQYAVIPAEVFAAGSGDPEVELFAEGAFVAIGSQQDVAAWASAFDHSVLELDETSKKLSVTKVAADDTYQVEAADGEVFSPAGSDLWVFEQAVTEQIEGSDIPASTHLRVPADLEPDQAVLLSTPAVTGIGSGASVVWAQDRSTPWAGPLLVLGGVLAVLGGVLYLLAIDYDRRGLGPRRGQRGILPGIRGAMERRRHARRLRRLSRANSVAAPALVLAGVLAVTGCSPSYWPDFSEKEPEVVLQPEQPPTGPSLPITEGQLERILDEVVLVASEADDALDVTVLESRFAGDALKQRTASYKIRADVPDYAMVPPRLSDEQLGYDLVQTTQSWPRTIFVAVASGTEAIPDEGEVDDEVPAEPEESEEVATPEAMTPLSDAENADEPTPSLALLLTQTSPHENYRVANIITLRGGITMPEAAPASEGTALLSPDTQTLMLSPGEIGDAFAAALIGELDEATAELFDLEDDPLIARSGIAWVTQSQERADADGFEVRYSVEVNTREKSVTSLSVSEGGALVAVTVVEKRVSDTEGSTTRVRAEGAISALSGLTGQQEKIVSEVAHQLLFYVPSKVSGETIQLLGATSELVGAGNEL